MKFRHLPLFFLGTLLFALATHAQTQKPLTNADVLNMTKQGFDVSLIVKDIQSNPSDFDVSPQALIDLKTAGVSQDVMEAMLSAHAAKPSAAVEAAHGAADVPSTAPNGVPDSVGCNANNACLLRDGTDVALKFAADISSRTAHEGDPVEFLLDDDLKVGDKIVAAKGSHAVATVSDAKKAGMMGKGGELNVQLQYLVVGSNHVHLRGTKGKEGDSRTGATVALTVLFGPIGLIKHGKDVQIAQGTPLKAYIDQDIWLPAITPPPDAKVN
jgi:hypothetical protein